MTPHEMTEREIRAVYAVAMAYDNRRLSEANITAWWEQARRNRWTFDEAREAVHEHFATSTDFLMPAHITAIIRNRRSKPESAAAVRELPATPLADPERIGRLLGQLSAKLGWRRPAKDPARQVECPYCHAAPHRPCTRLATTGSHRGEYIPITGVHPSRQELADQMEPE